MFVGRGIHAKVGQNQTDAGSILAQFSPRSGATFYRFKKNGPN